jgi:hypothetical protein
MEGLVEMRSANSQDHNMQKIDISLQGYLVLPSLSIASATTYSSSPFILAPCAICAFLLAQVYSVEVQVF